MCGVLVLYLESIAAGVACNLERKSRITRVSSTRQVCNAIVLFI